ncbi:hypothetical protein AWB74_08862 [Caballeronia arvi]|uniref:Uncharacterized protein n=1 Tax=Caballeronia arvi TaxID=1777135 RepID=A0A158L6E9_9BURK|nr:hypothetical protein AWB74_08862 [Caballeronia arvi]
MGQLAIGEYVPIDECAAAESRLTRVRARRSNAVVHGDTLLGKKALHTYEVLRKIAAAHMLEHADARHAVEAASDFAIVLQPDFDAIG